jgi:hypothetical protein
LYSSNEDQTVKCDESVAELPNIRKGYDEDDKKHGKWIDFFRPVWNNTDEKEKKSNMYIARRIIFQKVLQLVDKHLHFKDSIASFDANLELWKQEFLQLVPPEFKEYCPTTYEQVVRILSPLCFRGYECRACKNCHQVFWGAQANDKVCSICWLSGSPCLIVQYYSVAEYIRRLLLIPAYAHASRRAAIEERITHAEVGDVLSGKLFLNKYQQLSQKHDFSYLFAFIFHTDGIKLVEFPVASVTPFLAVNACLPLHIRFKFDAILCLSIFPRKAKNIARLSVPIIAELELLAATPLNVSVAQDDGSCRPCTVGVINLCAVNDSKATPLVNKQRQAPALHNACCQCFVCGISTKNGSDNKKGSTYYMGAICDLPMSHHLREEYRNEFKNVPPTSIFFVLTTFWNSPALPLKTSAWWTEAARKSDESSFDVENKQHPSHTNGIKQTSEFSKILDPLRQVRDDPAHTICNGISDLFKSIAAEEGFKLTKADREFEISLGRSFAPHLTGKKRLPWQADKKEIEGINKIVQAISFWTCAEPCRKTFRKEKFKLAEAFMYAGPLGHFIIEHLPSLDPKYRALYHAQINIYKKLLFRGFLREGFQDEVAQNNREVLVFLSKSEVLLPIKWNKMTRHQVKHSWDHRGFIPEMGSSLEWNMLGAERWGAFLKSLSHWGRKEIERSVHLKYMVLMGLDIFRCQNPHLFQIAPLMSTLASAIEKHRFKMPSYSVELKKPRKQKHILSKSERIQVNI